MVLMTTATRGEAARFLQLRNPGATIVITDLRDGSEVPHDRSA
jgi:hypothetical protein